MKAVLLKLKFYINILKGEPIYLLNLIDLFDRVNRLVFSKNLNSAEKCFTYAFRCTSSYEIVLGPQKLEMMSVVVLGGLNSDDKIIDR